MNAHNQRLEDADHSLRALCLRDVSGTNNALSPDEVVKMSESAVQGQLMAFLSDLFFSWEIVAVLHSLCIHDHHLISSKQKAMLVYPYIKSGSLMILYFNIYY